MLYLVVILASLLWFIRLRRRHGVVAFFHPYCNAGGGGERVLWSAIRTMQSEWPTRTYVVYSGDVGSTKEEILLKAKDRFGVAVDPRNVEFVFLRCRRLVEADLYPVCTLLFQTLAGGLLGLEALWKLNPEVFVDSMGYAFTLPLFRFIAGSQVAAYVHYPTISSDMISVVESRHSAFNNRPLFTTGPFAKAKIAYYQLFAIFYGLMGKCAHRVFVNGSWTGDHIRTLWRREDVRVVFPSCDVSSFLLIESRAEERFDEKRVLSLLSIGQIRPEKNHALQVELLKEVNEVFQRNGLDVEVELHIAGGCRHNEDWARVESLKVLAERLGVTNKLHWHLNVRYENLCELLAESFIFLHTMKDEHFGISVVEGLAAGCIVLAHRSGGPQMDIVGEGLENGVPRGFLASDLQEYSEQLLKIMRMSRAERDAIREVGRRSTTRFSDEVFARQWVRAIAMILPC